MFLRSFYLFNLCLMCDNTTSLYNLDSLQKKHLKHIQTKPIEEHMQKNKYNNMKCNKSLWNNAKETQYVRTFCVFDLLAEAAEVSFITLDVFKYIWMLHNIIPDTENIIKSWRQNKFQIWILFLISCYSSEILQNL